MSGKAIRETVGLLAVVAGLAFVGWEIRQNTVATRSATVLQLKENWSQLNLTMVQNPEMVDALDLVLDEGFENVDRRSHFTVEVWRRTVMHNWSNAYFQYRMGTLDPEQWQTVLRDMDFEATYRPVEGSSPPVWYVWDRNSYAFDDSFRTLMDSVRAANSDESTSSRSSR